jgi:DNA-binding LytR/AlgR family response regulator
MPLSCIVVDDEEVSRLVVNDFIERTENLELKAEFTDAYDAYKFLKTNPADIIFLDIEMPKMSGIELVKSLDDLPQVILITGRPDFGAEAFEYGLTDYLVKPIEYDRFKKAVNKAVINLEAPVRDTLGNQDIFIKANGRTIRLDINEVKLIESKADYVMLYTEDKRYIVHATMKSISKKFGETDPNFIRVHRSYTVNIAQVKEIDEYHVYVADKEISIGASYKKEFMKRINVI